MLRDGRPNRALRDDKPNRAGGRTTHEIRGEHPDLEPHIQHHLKSPAELYDRNLECLRALYRIDAGALWKSVRVPVLVLWG